MLLYCGPSELDNQWIAVVASGYASKTVNSKTGRVLQTYIMRADVNPWEASQQKLDSSICGDCPHRWSLGGGCYVNLRTVNNVWQAWRRGSYNNRKYQLAWQKFLENKGDWTIRLGSYGDPAAVPREVWDKLLEGAKGHTGYTHQWKKPQGQAVLDICMASVDTAEDAELCKTAGVRYFQVVPHDSKLADMVGSIECLSDAKGLTCAECRICYGTKLDRVLADRPQPVSVHIKAHGARSKKLRVVQ